MTKNIERLALRLSSEDRAAMRTIADALALQAPTAAPWARVTMSEAIRAALRVAAGVAKAGPLPL